MGGGSPPRGGSWTSRRQCRLRQPAAIGALAAAPFAVRQPGGCRGFRIGRRDDPDRRDCISGSASARQPMRQQLGHQRAKCCDHGSTRTLAVSCLISIQGIHQKNRYERPQQCLYRLVQNRSGRGGKAAGRRPPKQGISARPSALIRPHEESRVSLPGFRRPSRPFRRKSPPIARLFRRCVWIPAAEAGAVGPTC